MAMAVDTTDAIPAGILADLNAVCRQAGQGIVRDSDLLQRVYERSERAREETVLRHGVQNVGVEIIRELRAGR